MEVKWEAALDLLSYPHFLPLADIRHLESATASMRYSIYGFSNYLPLVANLAMFLIFTRFDLEEKLPKMREEVLARKEKK